MITDDWAIHLTGVRFDVHGHEPVPAGARGFRVGELAVAHEAARYQDLIASRRPRRAPPTPPQVRGYPPSFGAASGEPPVDNHGVGQLRLHGYPRTDDYLPLT